MLYLDFDWIPPDRQPVFGADSQTMATLCIRVGDTTVTTAIDEMYSRDYVTIPLYQMAKWLIANWYFIFKESENIRKPQPGFDFRHNLIHAAEGFLLPSMTIAPAENNPGEVLCKWAPPSLHPMSVRFMTHGERRIPIEEAKQPLVALIEATIEKLRKMGEDVTAAYAPETTHRQVLQMERTWEDVRDLKKEEYTRAARLLKNFKPLDDPAWID